MAAMLVAASAALVPTAVAHHCADQHFVMEVACRVGEGSATTLGLVEEIEEYGRQLVCDLLC